MNRVKVVAFVVVVAVIGASALAFGDKGPDLRAAVEDNVAPLTPVDDEDDVNRLLDTDANWRTTTPLDAVHATLAAASRPDEEATGDGDDRFLLYRSGTLWLTRPTSGEGTLVALYANNDRAYSRHGIWLASNRGWSSRIGSYNSSGGNGFRGGGSGSGK